jgi:hypothetical protein
VDDEWVKARLLRGIVLAAMALGAAAVVLAMFPGVKMYERFHDGWKFMGTRSAAEHPWWMLASGIVMLAPGVLVWLRPQLSYACLWSMIAFGTTLLWFVATIDHNGRAVQWWFRTVELWPATWFGYAIVLLVGGLVVALPMFCGVFALVTHRRERARPQLPVARVVRRT